MTETITVDLMGDVRSGEYSDADAEVTPVTKIVHIVVRGESGFDVVCDGRIAGWLTYGEMLETVIFNLKPAPTRGYDLVTREEMAQQRELCIARQTEHVARLAALKQQEMDRAK